MHFSNSDIRSNKFVLFGQKWHLDHIEGQWVDYYNISRSHMERDHLPPIRETLEEIPKLDRDQIVVQSYVGDLVKSFERKALAKIFPLFGVQVGT